MAVKVTGQFVPAGDFSIVDGKDISGNITGSNFSGSSSSTGSFGNLNISSDASVTGDMVVGGKLTAQEIHTEIESASIIFTSGSTKFGDTSDDIHRFTGSLKVTGSITATTLSGDGSGLTNVFENTAASSSISSRLTNLVSDSASFSTRISTAETELEETLVSASAQLADQISGSFTAPSASLSTRVTNLKSDSGSFSTRVTDLKTDSASFSSRITTAETELELTLISGSAQIATQISGAFDSVSSSLSSRLQIAETELENTLVSASAQLSDQISGSFTAPSASFSTRITKNEGTGSKILAGQLNFTDITATGTVQAEQLTSTDDITATGIITSNERINIQATNARLSLGPNAASIGSPALHGGVIFQDSSISSAALGNISGFGATTSGNASNYFLLQLAGGSGMYMQVANNGAITFPSATSFTVPLITSTGDITANGNIVGDGSTQIKDMALVSGSSTSTGSFGHLVVQGNITASGTVRADAFESVTGGNEIDFKDTLNITGAITASGGLQATTGNIKTQNSRRLQAFRNNAQYIEMYGDPNGFNYIQSFGGALRFAPNGGTKMILHTNGRLGLNTTVDAGYLLDVNGTGRFSDTLEAPHFSGSQFTGIFNGALSSSAQIASNISGAFAVASASFASDINNLQADSASFSTRVTDLKTDSGSFSTRVTDLKTDSGSFSTRVTNLKIDSGSFSTRVTKNEGTGSKILNGQLEFTNITGSGHISMSILSTGSFGRVSATTIGGHSPLVVDSNTTFIHSITSSAHVSSSMTSTASFGRVNVIGLGGHQTLTIDPITTFTNVITASSAVQFDGKIFIETGSIEGDLHVRTNENLMRIGKSTSGLIVSGSDEVSRFATGSDGSIIDLGFTVTDEDGNVVLAGDGDGIHVDDNNYWYNNKFYKVGNGSTKFLEYDAIDLKYKGQVFATTGSIDGEMYIKSPTGSMFIGKYTGGIPTSGSSTTTPRFATGSDGSLVDLGFTTTDEDGNTVFLTTGDGIVVDSNNYWYTTGHFKIGNSKNFINWNTSNLTISGTFVGDGSGLTGISGGGGSSFTKAGISGSFTVLSSSFSSRLTTAEAELSLTLLSSSAQVKSLLPTNVVSSSKQIASNISGSITQVSGALSTRLTTLEGNAVFTSAGISGSTTVLSSSLASRIKTLEDGGVTIPTNTVSSSAQLASRISGSFTALSASLADRITSGGGGGSDNLGNHTATQNLNLDGNAVINASNVSGSSTSTGSFGRTEVTSGKVLGDSTSAVSIPFSIVGGTSAAAGGLQFGAYNADFGGIWPADVTPAAGNYSFVARGGRTVLNTTTDIGFYLNDATILAFMTSTGVGIGEGSPDTKLEIAGAHVSGKGLVHIDSTDHAFIALDAAGASHNKGIYFQENGVHQSILEHQGTENRLRIWDGTTTYVTIGDSTGDIHTIGNISGSATSTGSFGNGEFAKTLRVGVTTPATNFSPIHLRGAASQTSTAMATLLVEDTTSHGGIAINAPANKQTHLRFQANGTLLWQVRMPQHDGTNPDSLRFYSYTHNNDVMTLKNDGTVGIGTINPAERLDVVGNIQASGNISGSAVSTGSFGFGKIADTLYIGETPIVPGGTQKFSISSDNHTVLNIQSVGSNKEPSIQFMRSNGEKYYIQHEGNGLNHKYYAGSGGSYPSYMFVDNSQNIGMGGQTSPSHKLDVTGTGRFTDTLTTAAINASGTITATSGSISNIQTPLTGRVISNFTELIKVTVVDDGGNHYAFEGATAPSIQVSEGKTYRFDLSDSSLGPHPFRLSTTQDGSHGGGSSYTTGVTIVGSAGSAGAYLEIQVDKNTANALYYYCTAHSGMGNDGRLLKNDLMNLAAIKVTGNQVDFTNLPTSNPNVAGRLWNDSGTVKISSG